MVSAKSEAYLHRSLIDCPVLSSSQAGRMIAAKSVDYSSTRGHSGDPLQFAHPASIFTFIFLALTAVSQILCLNRGLRSYDSTLVVPVFYGVVRVNAQLTASAHPLVSTRQVAS